MALIATECAHNMEPHERKTGGIEYHLDQHDGYRLAFAVADLHDRIESTV
jgi:hypothetical protein